MKLTDVDYAIMQIDMAISEAEEEGKPKETDFERVRQFLEVLPEAEAPRELIQEMERKICQMRIVANSTTDRYKRERNEGFIDGVAYAINAVKERMGVHEPK